MIYLVSPRRGGPHQQFALLASRLQQRALPAQQVCSLPQWLRLHRRRHDTIVSVVPFARIPDPRRFILNIRGNFYREQRLSNPLGYLYGTNIRTAAKIVVPSQYLKTTLRLPQALVIPNAIPAAHAPRPRAPSNTPLSLATATNFDFREKARGVTTIIRLLSTSAAARRHSLCVYGRGRYLSLAQAYAKRHARLPTSFAGQVPSLAQALANHDIFVYWSTFDNMPNVLLDALSRALPIVANDFGAFREIVGVENPLARSETEFVLQVEQLLHSPAQRQQYSAVNHARAQHFQIEHVIAQWLPLLTT